MRRGVAARIELDYVLRVVTPRMRATPDESAASVGQSKSFALRHSESMARSGSGKVCRFDTAAQFGAPRHAKSGRAAHLAPVAGGQAVKLKAHEVDGWVKGLKPDTSAGIGAGLWPPIAAGCMKPQKRCAKLIWAAIMTHCNMSLWKKARWPGSCRLALADEAAAMPMFGTHKLVHVSGANAAVQVAAVMQPYLAKTDEGNAPQAGGAGHYRGR